MDDNFLDIINDVFNKLNIDGNWLNIPLTNYNEIENKRNSSIGDFCKFIFKIRNNIMLEKISNKYSYVRYYPAIKVERHMRDRDPIIPCEFLQPVQFFTNYIIDFVHWFKPMDC